MPTKCRQFNFYKKRNSLLISELLQFLGDPCRIQTCNPHIRSVVLYSVELMDLFSAFLIEKRVQKYCFFFIYANKKCKKYKKNVNLFVYVPKNKYLCAIFGIIHI